MAEISSTVSAFSMWKSASWFLKVSNTKFQNSSVSVSFYPRCLSLKRLLYSKLTTVSEWKYLSIVAKRISICYDCWNVFIFLTKSLSTCQFTGKKNTLFLAIIKTKECIRDIIKASSTYKLVMLSVLYQHNPHTPVTMFTNPNEYYAAQI